MAPTATNTLNPAHDSFVSPAVAPALDVHPTARRAPKGGLIKVDSDATSYVNEDDGEVIVAKYTDRGASVISE